MLRKLTIVAIALMISPVFATQTTDTPEVQAAKQKIEETKQTIKTDKEKLQQDMKQLKQDHMELIKAQRQNKSMKKSS